MSWNKGQVGKIPSKEFYDICKLCDCSPKEVVSFIKDKHGEDYKLSTVASKISVARKKGILPLPSGNYVGNGEILKGTSTLYDEDGNVKIQWVKTDVEKENQLARIEAYIEDKLQGIGESYNPVEIPQFVDQDLTTFYPLPDLHFGLLVNKHESNHDHHYDMKIATEWVLGSMRHLVSTSPKSKYAIISDLGDFLHAMDDKKETKSGHQLDVDGRHNKIVDSAFEIMIQMIEMALEKHEIVYFYSVNGNHSEEVGIYLRAYVDAWFRNEPRVVVNRQNHSQQYHRFHRNIIGFTHGHEMRPDKAGEVMVYDNQSIFSDTLHRYYHFGHYHHNKLVEHTLCNVEIHKNITPRDKWAESMGFRGIIGDAKAIYYHSQYGEVGRSRFNIQMLKDNK